MSHMKEIEFYKDSTTYMLELDVEDSDNLVLESVTITGSKDRRKLEAELDPTEFEENLDIDDWQRIKETLTQEGWKP